MLGPISEFFAKILEFFNSFTGSFGWNAILLTVAFRVVILPLSIKQTKSMIAMQRLQPQLKEIQKKYKDDREKQGQEMMKLYKENKVSPLGGCLPLILQLPILFALFEVLRNTPAYVHYKTSFSFLGISNLIATGQVLWAGGKVEMYDVALKKVVPVKVAGGEYVAVIMLILLTILTGYVSSKMMTNDPKQAKMMMLMPVIFGVFAWILPAGVTIYILTTNVLMVAQQYVQLEADGFYDEKRAMRLKTGEPLKWHERWRFKLYDYGSIALTAVRIKKRPAQEEKKPAAAAGKEKGSAGQERKPAVKAAAGKKPAGKKLSGKQPAGKKPAGKRPAGKKPVQSPGGGSAEDRQTTGKPDAGFPAEKTTGTGVDVPPGSNKPEKGAGDAVAGAKHESKDDRGPGKPQARGHIGSKQYPAKKKGSRKK